VFNKFLVESEKLICKADMSAILVQLIPGNEDAKPISDEGLLLLAAMLDKYFTGIRFCKGTFGQDNILLAISNNKFKSYGNAF
jgi:hypothetical protein